MVQNTDFIGGMISGSAKAAAESRRGEKGKVFDWDKAAQMIKDRKPEIVEAGLQEDWSHTSGPIYMDGKPYYDGYTYLFSMWATPILMIDDEEIECFTSGDDERGYDSSTKWPESSLSILKN